jgi:hypothetical protein
MMTAVLAEKRFLRGDVAFSRWVLHFLDLFDDNNPTMSKDTASFLSLTHHESRL